MVNRITIPIFTFGSALAVAGLMMAQTAPPSSAGSKPAAASPTHPDSTAPKAGPVNSAITAPTDPNKVVLNIDGDKMTAAQFDEMIKAFPPQIQNAAKGPQRHAFIEQYVQLKLAAKEAERRSLDKQTDVKEQLAIQHDNVLASALYQDLVKNAKVSDADIQKYYDEHKNEFETAKAHHVLVRFKGSPVPLGKDKKELTDEEALAKAKEVQKRLAGGEDFAKVAKEDSDDTGTTNGDLGQFTRGQMVGPFDDAVFTLPVGKLSDPIKTQFGYHIIRVDSREAKTLDQVRPQIEQKIKPELAKKEVEALRAKSSVMIDDAFFKAPAGGPAGSPSGGPGGPGPGGASR